MRVIKTLKRMLIAKQKGDPKPNGRVADIAWDSAQRSDRLQSYSQVVHCENDEHGMPRYV